MGGALALLLAALAQLEPGAPRSGLRCYSFGSPPVLAHASGAGGDAVLQARCKIHHAQQSAPDALWETQSLLLWALKSGLPRCSLAPLAVLQLSLVTDIIQMVGCMAMLCCKLAMRP